MHAHAFLDPFAHEQFRHGQDDLHKRRRMTDVNGTQTHGQDALNGRQDHLHQSTIELRHGRVTGIHDEQQTVTLTRLPFLQRRVEMIPHGPTHGFSRVPCTILFPGFHVQDTPSHGIGTVTVGEVIAKADGQRHVVIPKGSVEGEG